MYLFVILVKKCWNYLNIVLLYILIFLSQILLQLIQMISDHPENYHLNVKKLPNTWLFFKYLSIKKKSQVLAIFCHSNGNFPEGQIQMIWLSVSATKWKTLESHKCQIYIFIFHRFHISFTYFMFHIYHRYFVKYTCLYLIITLFSMYCVNHFQRFFCVYFLFISSFYIEIIS